MIRSTVLTQYKHVTDRRTDRQTDGRTDGIGVAYTRYSIYAVARKKCLVFKDTLNNTQTYYRNPLQISKEKLLKDHAAYKMTSEGNKTDHDSL